MTTKIGLKLTLAVAATALLTISIFAWFNVRSHSASLLAEVERHGNQLSEAVKAGTEYDMLLNQRSLVHETIKRMGHQEGIERIRVMNKSGQIIYSSDAGEIGKMVDKNAESCYKCHFEGRPLERLDMKERTRVFKSRPGGPPLLGIINPIYNSPTCWSAECHVHSRSQVILGVLDVTMSLSQVDQDIRRSQAAIAIFAICAILALSGIVGLLVRRLVTIPVARLVDATQHVASGDLNYTIEEQGRDELGLLARSFNNMTRKLSDARLQLFQSDKLASLGRLAAGVAHEINNPLTGVLTYSSFLLKRTANQPEIQEDLKVIVRETIRSREIVKSLLDFARQSVPNKHEADLNEIICRAVAVVESQLVLNHVQLIRYLDASLPKPIIDGNQMQQVVINLLVNAVDAIGPQGGEVTLSTRVLSLEPAGTTQIKTATCPKRHSLIDKEFRINGKPAISLKAISSGEEGKVFINPMYGAPERHEGFVYDVANGIDLVCPQCTTSLILRDRFCPQCAAPLYAFESVPQGMIEGCVRTDCGWQRWKEVDNAGQKQYVELRVMDTGCGIPQDHLAKIFEPFYSTKGQKGTGLGLSVIWGIIDNHNGSISVESKVGTGTTFIVRIPVTSI